LSKAHQSQEHAARYFWRSSDCEDVGMTQVGNKDYYSVRADQARQHAEAAASEKVKSIHLDMAERYELLAKSGARAGERFTLESRSTASQFSSL
jgi:hypothetical protein